MTGPADLPATTRGGRTEPAVVVEPEVRWRVAGGVAVIELNRPARGNALSATLVEGLLAALGGATADPSVHTVAFAAAGRHFCTGFDLDGVDTASDGDLLSRFVRIETLLDAVWRAPVHTAAIATGRCWGAGADLFAACDLRIVLEGASFRFPGAAFGLVLGTRRLAERVGTERAREWIAGGAELDAAAAAAAGLASRIAAPADAAPAEARDLWPWRLELLGGAPAIDRDTLAAIRAASRFAGGPGADALADADLAALVRSAARPGLRARLIAYRERVRTAADVRTR